MKSINLAFPENFINKMNKTKDKHPATFSDQIPIDFISCFTKKDDIVLDPMAGSGTVLVAATNLQRNYIGIDISQEYVDICKQRLSLETKPLLKFF